MALLFILSLPSPPLSFPLSSPVTIIIYGPKAVLDQIKDEWGFVIDPDVRSHFIGFPTIQVC